MIAIYNYACDGLEVSKEEYDRLNDQNECYSYFTNNEACYCPVDYYGIKCENQRKIICNLTMIYPTKNNCEYDSKYNSNILGYPNCIRGTNESTFN